MAWSVETHTASDGYRLHYREYAANGPARADIVCIHGIQSHAGWYEKSCSVLAGAGYRVRFVDRRGSGMNSANRGDAPGFRRLLDDLAEFLKATRCGRPVVLLAISWGGKVAAALERRHPGLVDAVALICPGFCPRLRVSLRQRLAVVAARIFVPRRYFDIPLAEAELFTATPARIQFIRDDPLSLRQATARLLVESARLDGYLRWFPPRIVVPLLLMLAGRDRIVDNVATRALVEKMATHASVVEYAGAHHTLEFEPGMPFVTDLLNWLNCVI